MNNSVATIMTGYYGELSYCTEDLVKLISGAPSSMFHILAEPSMDDETKNFESKLHEKGTNTVSGSKVEEMNLALSKKKNEFRLFGLQNK